MSNPTVKRVSDIMQQVGQLLAIAAAAAESHPEVAAAICDAPPFTRSLDEEAAEYFAFAERLAEGNR